jgi:hypothetical protein
MTGQDTHDVLVVLLSGVVAVAAVWVLGYVATMLGF